MSWVRLEDNFIDHPKVVALSAFALRVWLRAICHCNQHGTNGFVSDRILARIGCTSRVRDELIAAPTGYEHGLFEATTGGLLVHDYAQYQTQHVVDKAESGRKGGLKSGEVRRAKSSESRTSHEAPASFASEAPASGKNEAHARVPVPSRPVPSREEEIPPPPLTLENLISNAETPREQEYQAAYERGVERGIGRPHAMLDDQRKNLHQAILGHAKDANGVGYRGAKLLEWITWTASEFARWLRDQPANEQRFYSGFGPRGMHKWLNETTPLSDDNRPSGKRQVAGAERQVAALFVPKAVPR